VPPLPGSIGALLVDATTSPTPPPTLRSPAAWRSGPRSPPRSAERQAERLAGETRCRRVPARVGAGIRRRRHERGSGGLLQRRRRGHPAGRLGSVRDLKEAIRTYIDGWNERCKPFVWTKDADTILAKAQRPTTSLRYRDTRPDLPSEAQGPCAFENRPTRPRFQPEGEHRAGCRWQRLVGGAQSCLHRAASSGAAGPDRVAGRGRDGERGDRRSFGATGHCKVPLPVGDQRGLTCSCRGAAAWTSGGDARQRRTGRRRKTRRMRQS